MTAKLDQFALELDTLLGLHHAPTFTVEDSALKTASHLIGMDMDAGAAPKPELRALWISRTRTLNPKRSTRSLLSN